MLVLLVYPAAAHWVWSAQGFASASRVGGPLLLGSGVVDFAGCGPVHTVGGVAALAGAWVQRA
jgi:Amt family ammonium transporter